MKEAGEEEREGRGKRLWTGEKEETKRFDGSDCGTPKKDRRSCGKLRRGKDAVRSKGL